MTITTDVGAECVRIGDGEVLWIAKKARAWGWLDDDHLVVATMVGLVLLDGQRRPRAIVPELFSTIEFAGDRVIAARKGGAWWLIGVAGHQLVVLSKKAAGPAADAAALAKLAKTDPDKPWKKVRKLLDEQAAGGFGWVVVDEPVPAAPPPGFTVVPDGATFTVAIDGVTARLPEPLMGAGHDSPPWRQRYMCEHASAVAVDGGVACVAGPGERAFEVDLAGGAATKIADLWRAQCGWKVRAAYPVDGGWLVASQERVLFVPRGGGDPVIWASVPEVTANGAYDLEGTSGTAVTGGLLWLASSHHDTAWPWTKGADRMPYTRVTTLCLAHGGRPWLSFHLPLYRARLAVVGGRLLATDGARVLALRDLDRGLTYFRDQFCASEHTAAFAPDWATYRP